VQLEQADWTVCDQNCRQDKGQLSLIFSVLPKYSRVSCITHAILKSFQGYGNYISPTIRQDKIKSTFYQNLKSKLASIKRQNGSKVQTLLLFKVLMPLTHHSLE
jgi:hypothetical protein